MSFTFYPAQESCAVFDFVEATVTSHNPITDPFRTVAVTATLNGKPLEGFCDAQNGAVYRVRFMPTVPDHLKPQPSA
jgi:hypothetical protein